MNRRPIIEWTAADVARWLGRNGLDEYADRFIEEAVTGRALLGLTPALTAALIPRIGPQAEFNYILSELKSESSKDRGRLDLDRLSETKDRGRLDLDRLSETKDRGRLDLDRLANTRARNPRSMLDIGIPHSNESQISANDQSDDNFAPDDDVTSPLMAQPSTNQSDASSSSHVSLPARPSGSGVSGQLPSYVHDMLFGSDFASTDEFCTFLFSDIPAKLMRWLVDADSVQQGQGRCSERNQLIRCVCDQLQKITLYPTTQQYRHAGHAIVTRFPHLRDDSKTGFDIWARSLRDRCKNQRRGMTDNPAVLERKSRHRPPGTFSDLAQSLDRMAGSLDRGLDPMDRPERQSKVRRIEEVDEEIEDIKLFYEPQGEAGRMEEESSNQ